MSDHARPWLLTCVGVAFDLPLLAHWIRHYRTLGIEPDRFLVILNAQQDDAPGYELARGILRDEGVTREPIIWTAPFTSETMWKKRGAVQGSVCAARDWVLNADVDEFQRWPEPLADCLARAERLGADCVQGVMIDRLAPGGKLAAVMPEPDIFTQFPIRAEVAQAIGGSSAVHGRGGTVKLMAGRAYLHPARGGHRPLDPAARFLYRAAMASFWEIDRPAFRFSVPTQVDHVHWTDQLSARLEIRLATPGVSPAGAEYGGRQLAHIRAHDGISLSAVTIEPHVSQPDWPTRLAQLRRRGLTKRFTAPIRRWTLNIGIRAWLKVTGR